MKAGLFASIARVPRLTGRVNQHFWRLFGAVLISGALRGGQQALQVAAANEAGAGNIIVGIAGQASQVAQQRLGRALDTRPTIAVDAGQLCQVLLIKALKLPAMWE
jgi:type IV secretory pathway VirB10-like protein